MKLHEIHRLQTLAGIINEITVTPSISKFEPGDTIEFKSPDSPVALSVKKYMRLTHFSRNSDVYQVYRVYNNTKYNNEPSIQVVNDGGWITTVALPQSLFTIVDKSTEEVDNRMGHYPDLELNNIINEIRVVNPAEDDEIDLQETFDESPMSHSYNEVLEIIESYEDESILNDFKAEFPEGEDISRKDYSDFAMSMIDDMSEVANIQANWISLTDPDIYDKAGLV
jgi:hypothetical protein